MPTVLQFQPKKSKQPRRPRYREEVAIALVVKCRSALLKLDPRPQISPQGEYTPDLVTHFIDDLNGALYAAPIREGHWLKEQINSYLPAGMIERMEMTDDEFEKTQKPHLVSRRPR